MIAQKKYEVARPVVRRPKRRKRTNLLRGLINNQMVCVLLVAIAVLFMLIPYASAYAKVMEKGYHKADLMAGLSNMRLENEALRLRLESLREPDRIAQFATAIGMVSSEALAYLRPVSRPNLAQNPEPGNLR
jgi:cell division protein FtsL